MVFPKKIIQIFYVFPLILLGACSSQDGPSEAELTALQSTAFVNNFNAHSQVGDVHSSMDALPPSKPFHVSSITEAIEVPVRDCTTEGLFEMEKQMALSEAAADATGQTIPVKFAYSFGRKHDTLAKWANKRAVLSANNEGISYIPVGGKKSSRHGRKHAYYTADNTEVKRQYKTGEKCFFSTIKIDPESFTVSSSKYDFIKVTEEDVRLSHDLVKSKRSMGAKLGYLKHMIHYMYYGYCRVGRCAKDQAFAGDYANRLFNEIPSVDNGEPQIIKLYMADLRSEQMKHDIVRLSEDTTRGEEIDTSIDNILNVCKVHENYYDVTKNLSLPAEAGGYTFDPIDGAVQLLHNILSHDVDGTMLSTQYTPIVIDLDGDGVKTSSVRWGTYFNMAALENKDGVGQSHRSAWIGGNYEDYNPSIGDSRVALDVRLKATDGFLVVPNQDGQVTSSTQMFGDNMKVGGKTYQHGFEALQAFAGKSCDSDYPEHRYVGPWDGEIYSDKLKLWVDENRNGVSDNGEVKGLKESGVVAINACHIVHANESDSFGNGTHLRSAVLMVGDYPWLADSEDDILSHLQYGQSEDGTKATFHLAIDLIFKTNTDERCPAGMMSQVDYPAIPLPDDDIGIGSGDPVPVTPSVPVEPPAPPQPPSNF